MHGILALIMAIFLANQAGAGTWTDHQFIYKPSLGARGNIEKNTFDSGLDRVDAHLGRYKTLGDPGYATLSEALTTIGSVDTTLAIPVGTINVTGNTTIPANVHLRMFRGGKFDIGNSVTLTINGPFEAGLYQVFAWSGTGKVVFGNGAVSEVYPEWWGAKADYNPSTGVGTDSADAINAALAACRRVKLQAGSYYISKAIQITFLSQLAGHGATASTPGTTIYPALTGGTWINGRCIAYNTVDGSNWVQAYPMPGGAIRDIIINGYHNSGYTDAKGIIFAGSFTVERVSCYKLKGGIARTSNYADLVRIVNFQSGYSQADANNYEIHLPQVGDGLLVMGCHVYSPGSSGGVRIDYCGGGLIASNIFNCNQTYEYNRSLVVQATHAEAGVVSVKNSNMSFRDCHFKRSTTGAAVAVTSDANATMGHVLFDNCEFMQWPNQDFTTEQPDIDGPRCITIRNCRRKYENGAGYVEMKAFTGIQVSYGGNPVTTFNKYSHEYSNYCEFRWEGVIPHPWVRILPIGGGTFYPISWLGTSVHSTWREANGTYYYKAQMLVDSTRMVGKTSANEQNVAVTNGGNGVHIKLTGDQEWLMTGVIIRLYRGTATGSYDEYVDIPMPHRNTNLFDDGHAVCGYVWQDRTAGGADSVTTMTQVEFVGDKVRAIHTDAPTVGTWTQGDHVQEKDLAGGAPPGWFCTEGGAPGTWKAMANLAN
jgi:hypothetical protein